MESNKDQLNQFFTEKNTVKNIQSNDFINTGEYLDIIRAFARITYKSIYIIDYQKKAFEYVSDNPLFLCGLKPEQVKELGYGFYFRNVKSEDLDLLVQINEIGFDFYEQIPLDDRKLYTISYDFHLINEKGKPILINHKLTPMFLNEEGKIWKAMCIVALSNNQNAGNISINRHGSDIFWSFSLEIRKWNSEQKAKLSERELEMLRLYARGLTINEIAEKMFLSADTVKFHRRKLFEKVNVQNITEALAFATNNKLI
ncbi:helix-turn-helix transcriptional regulator [uncultured Chryseobacterium sp.]|uniref:response regulator transcription factor n=1 Tax=uncultured Chryseobacterium sp. TaxID=259322 RepID=UPI0025E6C6FB|nr:helix-turn-helix transcriptional regulator [uncultured Chryseobacterium sp.]